VRAVSAFVTVTSQMSRSSYDLPIDSSVQRFGRFLLAHVRERVAQLVVRVEMVVRDGAHVLVGQFGHEGGGVVRFEAQTTCDFLAGGPRPLREQIAQEHLPVLALRHQSSPTSSTR